MKVKKDVNKKIDTISEKYQSNSTSTPIEYKNQTEQKKIEQIKKLFDNNGVCSDFF